MIGGAPAAPALRDLVLVGGGHAHVEVLRRFGLRPQAGTRLTLIVTDSLATYSGMLPGLLAGHYRPEDAQIDLRRLSAFAGARFYRASASGLDLGRRLVLCDGRPPVPFDLLSLDIGSVPDTASLAGADRFALPARPAARFLEAWRGLRETVAARGREGLRSDLVVVGGGAAGIELALSLRHRLAAECGRQDALRLTVLAGAGELLPGHGPAARRRALAALHAAGIRLLRQRAIRLTEGWVHTETGEALPALAAILATHAAAPPWLRETGLALDGSGFVRTDSTLRSVSHPEVFAAGDVAAVADRALPKSGVFAVRQGPVLARNLRRSLEGRPLLRYRPQRRALALLSTGPRHAIASYGRLACSGAWVWRLKDRIDRRWIAMYRQAGRATHGGADDGGAARPPPAGGMRCGGGAKAPGPVPRRVLGRIRAVADRPDVVCGLTDAGDAAVLDLPPGRLLVQTAGQFRAFLDDPYLFGRIATNHCLGDIHAMGAAPHSALALVGMPCGPEEKVADDLLQLMAGAIETLREAGAVLVGGHTAESAEMTFGLAVNGLVRRDAALRKGGARPGDALVLTKPLGAGVILAAAMRRRAPAPWIESAIAAMLVSNRDAAECLVRHGATACTDVTGLGVLGHLLEVLGASGVRAEMDLDALPSLDGALELLREGLASTLHPANRAAFGAAVEDPQPERHPAYGLLFDPQTAGGLLAAVPDDAVAACLAALRALPGGGEAAVVGRVLAGRDPARPVRLIAGR